MNENNGNEMLSQLLKAVDEPVDAVSTDSETAIGSPALDKHDEIIDMGDDFDFDGFQVVRREFFAHLNEPSVTFNNCKFGVNMACLAKFPTSDYAQVMINRQKKILALRPCPEGARDSFQWCSVNKKGKRQPKHITCKLFFAKVVTMMDWNPDYRYKLLGKLIHANGEYLLAFDLTATEVYQRTFKEGQKPKTSRIPIFPSEWQDQFGLPFNEHRQTMQIKTFDGYAIINIRENEPDGSEVQMPITDLVPTVPSVSIGGVV